MRVVFDASPRPSRRAKALERILPVDTSRRAIAARKRRTTIARDLAEYRKTPADRLPMHVRHCHGTGANDWWIHTCMKHAMDGVVTRIPYHCNSWRCPVCRHHEAHIMYARIAKAAEPLDPNGWCFLVLTLDRHGTYTDVRKWQNAQAAYKDLSTMSGLFMQNLRRWQARELKESIQETGSSGGWEVTKKQWVATVEAHKAKTGGWPHVNIMLWSPKLAEWLRKEREEKEADGLSGRDAVLVSRELADCIERAGWGIMSTAEAADSPNAVAGYITKIANKADQTTGEIAKLTQLPMNAPFKFRRLRCGVGFLPPRKKNPNVTGALVRRQREGFGGGIDVLPIHSIKDPKLIEFSERACAREEQIFIAELEAEVRCVRQLKRFGHAAVELPPVTRWLGKLRLERGPPMNDTLLEHEKYLARPA